MKLNHERILERIDELKGLNVYLPLVLYMYVGEDYLYQLSEQEKRKYYTHRVELMGANDYNQYLIEDLTDWLKKHKQFQDIIKE